MLEDIAKDIIDKLKQEISFQRHNASGTLSDSFEHRISTDTINIQGRNIPTSAEITIYAEDYSDYVETGTRPHRPPIDAIQEWINIKGLELNAWAVAKSIEKHGTPTPRGRSIAPRRTGYIQYVLDNNDYSSKFAEYLGTEIQIALDNYAQILNNTRL